MVIPTDPGQIRRFGPDILQLPDSKTKLSLNLKDVLSARVLKSVGPGQFLLAVRGNQIVAQSSADLVPGKVYLMEVKATEPMPVLALAKEAGRESTTKVLAKLISGLRQSPLKDLAGLLQTGEGAPLAKSAGPESAPALSEVLSRLSLGGEKPITADAVRNFLQGSGLMWESKLGKAFIQQGGLPALQQLVDNDIKGNILQLLSRPGLLEAGLAEKLTGISEALQNLQLANVTALEDNGRFFLSIPFLQGEEFHFIQFLADLSRESGNKEGKEKNGLVTASLSLELSELGPIRADAALLGNFLRAAFTLSSEESARFLESRVGHLEDRLKAHGITLSDVDFSIEEAATLKNTSLADELFYESPGALDFVV